jgi:hypothetical protein
MMRHAPDILALTGFALLGYGLWLVYEPAAFITCGSILLGVAGVAAWRKA